MQNDQYKSSSDECHTLYIGNLDKSVTDSLLVHLFSSIAPVRHCKIVNEGQDDIYGFIEFENHRSASHALDTMNGRSLEGRPMKINWASSNNSYKVDTSRHYHVFVGDLCPDLKNETLLTAFKKFGDVSDCKIIRDSTTLKSKGYGFISYPNKEDAEYAIREMNGVQLGSKVIRTNWASRRNFPAYSSGVEATASQQANALSYSEVYKLAGDTNTTVYCGGITTGTTVNDLQTIFSEHGNVVDVKVFGEKGYAFIKFSQKDSAARAIVKLNGTKFCDRILKCFWGKETEQLATPKLSTPMPVSYPQYYQQMGYDNSPQVQPQYPPMAMDPSMQQQQAYQQSMYYQNWMNTPQSMQMGMQYPLQHQQPLGYDMIHGMGYAQQGEYHPQ